MPLTEKGKKIKKAMQKQYGEEKGERVFYASKNKGTIEGVDGLELSWDSEDELFTNDVRRRRLTERDPMGRVKGTYTEEDAWSSQAREASARARVRAGSFSVKKYRSEGKRSYATARLAWEQGGRKGEEPDSSEHGIPPMAAQGIRWEINEHVHGSMYGPKEDKEDSVMGVEIIGDAGSDSIQMFDTIEVDDAAKVRVIDGGYLTAMPRIARSGVQVYKGVECQRDDVESVRVYRPQDEVFKDTTVRGYTHLPVTLGHPKVMVTAKNWKEFAVGDTGDEVLRDGSSVRVPMMLRDAAAVEAYKQGTNQLSVGYQCELDWTPGITEDGEEYDAVQRGITPNHLAVVANARGGSNLRIGDDRAADEGDTAMNLKTVMVDGIECQMSDTAASVVQRTVQRLLDQVENFKKKAKDKDDDDDEKDKKSKKDAADAKTAIDAKDAEIVTLKTQLKDALDPARRDAELKDFLSVGAKAKSLLGDSFKTDGKQVNDIRREVVNAKVGEAAKGWSDDQITASFNTLAAGTTTGGRIADAAAAFSRPHFAFTDEREKAYAEAELRDQNAWKGEQKTA